MNLSTLKTLFLTTVFMLLGCLAIQAADDGLITKQITIKLDKAGTLSDKIGSTKKYKITNLKIVGEINGTDWQFIRNMAGGDSWIRESTSGKLSKLDLSEVTIAADSEKGYAYSVGRNGGITWYYVEDKETIPKYMFVGCHSLQELIIPSYITSIGVSAFNNSGLTSLVIPSGVTSIGESAFDGCRGLTSLVIPSSVTSIGASAFRVCSGLTSLVIPSSVTSIGELAFRFCSGLTSLVIPSSVTSIGELAFDGCNSLKNVQYQISDDIGTYLSKDHPDIDVECGIEYYLDNKKITSVMIPSSITKLGECIFQRCKDLNSVYVSWAVPISAPYTAFKNADVSNITLYVPQGTYQDYWLADVWGDFGNIVEYDVTGVDNVTTSTNTKEVSRYSANGHRLSAPTKGLNIVKYSDGSVKKVVVQ